MLALELTIEVSDVASMQLEELLLIIATWCYLPVSEMTYTVSSGTLNPSIPYHWCYLQFCFCFNLSISNAWF